MDLETCSSSACSTVPIRLALMCLKPALCARYMVLETLEAAHIPLITERRNGQTRRAR